MRKLRLALSKGEEVRFLSHLDYAQMVERMIRRAQIKMAYSEGFNPHMKISFSSALALGITAEPEYVDMDVLDENSLANIMARLEEQAPPGVHVLDGAIMEGKVKKMMAICNYAEYIVESTVEGKPDWDALVKPINEATSLPYEKVTPKKRKMIDLKRFLRKPLQAEQEGNKVRIFMAIGIYPDGSVKASEVWEYGKKEWNWPVGDDYAIHRQAIMIETDGVCKTPLEV